MIVGRREDGLDLAREIWTTVSSASSAVCRGFFFISLVDLLLLAPEEAVIDEDEDPCERWERRAGVSACSLGTRAVPARKLVTALRIRLVDALDKVMGSE